MSTEQERVKSPNEELGVELRWFHKFPLPIFMKYDHCSKEMHDECVNKFECHKEGAVKDCIAWRFDFRSGSLQITKEGV